jgi:hypothetical protein
VLEIKALNGAQVPHPAPTPEWGLHLLDGNIATGNLLAEWTRGDHRACTFIAAVTRWRRVG